MLIIKHQEILNIICHNIKYLSHKFSSFSVQMYVQTNMHRDVSLYTHCLYMYRPMRIHPLPRQVLYRPTRIHVAYVYCIAYNTTQHFVNKFTAVD